MANDILKPGSFTDANSRWTGETNIYDQLGTANDQTTAATYTLTAADETQTLLLYGWQTKSYTYSSATLNINWRTSATTGDDCFGWQYSTNSGTNWITIRGTTGTVWRSLTVRTDTVVLSADPDLSQYRFRVNVDRISGSDNIQLMLYDVWTLGTYTPPTYETLQGQFGGLNDDSANAKRLRFADGAFGGSDSMQASGKRLRGIEGAYMGTEGDSGLLRATKRIAGAFSGVSDNSASLKKYVGLEGRFSGVSDNSADLTVTGGGVVQALAGAFSGTSDNQANLGRIRRKVVDTGGAGDYTSLYNWEAGQQKNLTSFNEIAVADCRCTTGVADTSLTTVAGWTSSATNYVKIWADPSIGYRHSGKWDDTKYRVSCTKISNDTGAIILTEYGVIDGIQAEMASNQNQANPILWLWPDEEVYPSYVGTIKNCIVRKKTGSTYPIGGISLQGGGTGMAFYFYNNISYDCDGDGGFVAYNGSGTDTSYMFNNTAHNCSNGFWCGGAGTINLYWKNNLAQDCTTACYNVGGESTTNCSNNCSDDGTQPGSSGQNGEVTFVDESGDDFRLAKNDTVAKDNGTTISETATDIEGRTRSGTYDIGASEARFWRVAGQFDTLGVFSGDVTTQVPIILAGQFGSTCDFSANLGRIRRKVVDPDGAGDYTSLYNWESGQQKDLTAVNEISVADCQSTGGTADNIVGTGSVDISGWTTSSTNYVKIWCDPTKGYRHSGKWDDTKYRILYGASSTGSNIIRPLVSNVFIDGLQVSSNSLNTFILVGCALSSAIGNLRVTNCIVRTTVVTPTNIIGICMVDGSEGYTTPANYAINNICYNLYGGIYYRSSVVGVKHIIYNNTVVDCINYGIRTRLGGSATSADLPILKNNLVFNCVDDYYIAAVEANSEYNAYSQGTDPGTDGLDISGSTGSQVFLDYANDDFRIAHASPVEDEGTNLSSDPDNGYSFSTDIEGRTRETTWDIGASEAHFWKVVGAYSGLGDFFGDLTLATVGVIELAGSYAGLGTYSATAKRTRSTEGMFSGTGYFSASGKRWRAFEGQYAGTESESATLRSSTRFSGSYSGLGSFSVTGKLDKRFIGTYSGTGYYSLNLGRIRTKIVDPDGTGHYTSINSWEAGQEKNLVTNNEIAVAKCRCTGGSADTSDFAIGGWTTDSNHYIKIWTDPSEGYRHNGIWQTGNKFRVDFESLSEGDELIWLGEGNIRIDGLQLSIKSTISDTGLGYALIYGYGAMESTNCDIRISNCVMRIHPDSVLLNNYYYGINFIYTSDGYTKKLSVWNNILYDIAPLDRGYAITVNSPTANTIFLYNNTIANCNIGIFAGLTGSYAVVAKNNICQDCLDYGYSYLGNFSALSTNNCDDDSSAPATNRQTGEVEFLNETGKDFRLSLNDTVARENGYDLSTDPDGFLNITDDIEGRTRPYKTSWDIGASEAHIWKLIGKYKGVGTFVGTVLTGAIAIMAGVFSGLGSFSASAKRWRGLESAFAGLGSFSALIKRTMRVAGAYSGLGTFSAFTRMLKYIEGQFAGLGTFSATTFQAGVQVLRGMFSADSTLSANAKRRRRFISAMSGLGTFSGLTRARKYVRGVFSGLSSWQGSIKKYRSLEAINSALGSFSATIRSWTRLSGRFSGLGTFSGSILLGAITALVGVFAGLGSFRATTRRIRFLDAAFSGFGSFSGRIKRVMKVAGEFSGISGFSGSLKKFIGIAGEFAALAVLSARLSVRMVIHGIISALGSFTAYMGTAQAEEAEGILSAIGEFRANLGRLVAGLLSPSYLRKSKIKTELMEESKIYSNVMRKSKIKEMVDE